MSLFSRPLTLYSRIHQTGLLKPWAPVSLLQFGLSAARYGASLFTLAAWNARRFPRHPALVEGGRTVGFAELVGSAMLLAQGLAQTYPRARSFALLGRNRIAYVEALLACGRLGVDTLLLNTQWGAGELRRLLLAHPVEVLLYDLEFQSVVETASAGLAGLERAGLDQRIEGGPSLDDLRARPSSAKPLRRGSGRLTLLTSGTTGPAKPVRRSPSPSELQGLLLGLLGALEPRVGEAVLLTVPLLHGHGLATLALSLSLAAPLYLYPEPRAGLLLDCLLEHPIRVMTVVPTLLHRLLEAAPPGFRPAALRVVCGSAPLAPTLAQRTLRRWGPVLYNLYGSSETGLISLATPSDLAQFPDSVGRPFPGVRLHIHNPQGNPNQPGEVWVGRGGTLRPTDDLGRLDAEGRLFLLGRQDEMLILGGENVYPQHLEARITEALGYVQECAVVGLPDPEYGQAVHLFVVLKAGHHVEVAQIARDLAQTLPRTLRPKQVTLLESLPRNLAGKVQRFRLGQP